MARELCRLLLWLGGSLLWVSTGLASEGPEGRLERSLGVARLLGAPAVTLPTAAVAARAELEEIAKWNAAGRLPFQSGLVRVLPERLEVELARATAERWEFLARDHGWVGPTPWGDVAWGTWVSVEAAARMRLHLDSVDLPDGTWFAVYGADAREIPFGLELRDGAGGLWTPSVEGGDLFLEVVVPAVNLEEGARAGFTLDRVAELLASRDPRRVPGDGRQPELGECIQSATCTPAATFPAIESVRAAIASLEIVSGVVTYLCTGGLIADQTVATEIPYLITARHCIDTLEEAASVEATWDFRPTSCGGPLPPTFEVSNGSNLLATVPASDLTLLRLVSVPSGRTYLDWTTTPPADGTTLHRLSHPLVSSALHTQSYSRSTLSTSFAACLGAARPDYLYAIPNLGGTFGGSSGAPLLLADGRIVGQLRGGCGPNPPDGCDYGNAEVDGAFARSFPSLSPYLVDGASFADSFELGTLALWMVGSGPLDQLLP